jgi:hypothetical protein
MNSVPGTGVRPTKLALGNLDIVVPDLGVALESIPHPLLERAQSLPATVDAAGAERIIALDDLIWLKVKTGSWRGAATRHEVLAASEPDSDVIGCWWLGAVGSRRADSAQDDFYDRLELACVAQRKALNRSGSPVGTSTVSSHLLPDAWDADRLRAEVATHARRRIQQVVRDMAAESMRTGHMMGFTFAGCEVRVLIRADDGIVYIAIGASGISDYTTFALLFSSIPGLQPDDWGPEPNGAAGLNPEHGEILWSALLPPEAQDALLD